jgi:hypothetical protein
MNSSKSLASLHAGARSRPKVPRTGGLNHGDTKIRRETGVRGNGPSAPEAWDLRALISFGLRVLRASVVRYAGISAATLAALPTVAAEAPDRPLRVLYLGAVEATAGGLRGGGARTNYVYLPGQTLAPEAIYFDHLADPGHLSERYLSHFDAVVQVMSDAEVGAGRGPWVEGFAKAGKGWIRYADGRRPADTELREAVLGAVNAKARSAWQASLAARTPLRRLPGEVPNYERRPEPVQYQAPLSPQDSMRYTQVPADCELRLFAAEPDVVKPIWLAWDERGRAWVVEARDYPHGLVNEGEPGKADIKICEDTDGDGKADRFTIFADGLNLATSLVFANGGILVSEARHLLFLQDTDGDDRADVRKSVPPGWGTATRTRCKAASAAGSTTGSTARSVTRTSGGPSGARNSSSARACFASGPMAPRWSSCTSSTTTPGASARTPRATPSARPRMAIRRSTATCRPTF